MTNLKHLLTKPLTSVPTKVAVFALVIALIGFADAAYLTVEHYKNVIPPCSITGGCQNVLTSQYATLIGIPVSLLGVVFYFLVLIGLFAYIEGKHLSMLKWSLILTIPGFLFSLFFIYLQVFVIHSYCAYCIGSAITSTILFVTAMEVFSRYSESKD